MAKKTQEEKKLQAYAKATNHTKQEISSNPDLQREISEYPMMLIKYEGKIGNETDELVEARHKMRDPFTDGSIAQFGEYLKQIQPGKYEYESPINILYATAANLFDRTNVTEEVTPKQLDAMSKLAEAQKAAANNDIKVNPDRVEESVKEITDSIEVADKTTTPNAVESSDIQNNFNEGGHNIMSITTNIEEMNKNLLNGVNATAGGAIGGTQINTNASAAQYTSADIEKEMAGLMSKMKEFADTHKISKIVFSCETKDKLAKDGVATMGHIKSGSAAKVRAAFEKKVGYVAANASGTLEDKYPSVAPEYLKAAEEMHKIILEAEAKEKNGEVLLIKPYFKTDAKKSVKGYVMSGDDGSIVAVDKDALVNELMVNAGGRLEVAGADGAAVFLKTKAKTDKRATGSASSKDKYKGFYTFQFSNRDAVESNPGSVLLHKVATQEVEEEGMGFKSDLCIKYKKTVSDEVTGKTVTKLVTYRIPLVAPQYTTVAADTTPEENAVKATFGDGSRTIGQGPQDPGQAGAQDAVYGIIASMANNGAVAGNSFLGEIVAGLEKNAQRKADDANGQL